MAPCVTQGNVRNACLQWKIPQSTHQTHTRRLTASLQKDQFGISFRSQTTVAWIRVSFGPNLGNNSITVTKESMLQNPQSSFYLKCYYHKIPDYEMKTSDSHSNLTHPPFLKYIDT